MRSICRQITEKRLILIFLNKFQSFGEPDISAVAAEFFSLPVAEVGVIKIIIVPVVGLLSNPASANYQNFIEASVLRAKRITVAQMPFADDARGITEGLQPVGYRRLGQWQTVAGEYNPAFSGEAMGVTRRFLEYHLDRRLESLATADG